MSSKFVELGTATSGFASEGPFSCADCIHKLSPSSSVCIHPVVVNDPELKTRKVPGGIRVDLQTDCCRFVRPPKEASAAHPIAKLRSKPSSA